MRFYYFSIFSWILYGTYCVVALSLFWWWWTKYLKRKVVSVGYLSIAPLILVLPWTEELWIARTFDSLCRKDAGIFINKVVEVDGYYEENGVINRIVGRPPFKFIESPDSVRGKYRRVERASDEEKVRVLAWSMTANAGKKLASHEWVTQKISDQVQVTVEPDTGFAWRITQLDQPTARYHFKSLNKHTPISHGITRFEDVVIDTQTNEVIGRYTNYYRGAYWFFLSLGRTTIPCEEAQADSRQFGSLISRQVLKPLK